MMNDGIQPYKDSINGRGINLVMPALTDQQFKALSRPEKRRYFRNYMTCKEWRLNNLYKIENDKGRVVTFRMRDAQRDLFETAHTFELILKARQLGFSTFIDLYALDSCLFNKNYAAGIIAQDLESAGAIFQTKVVFPYNNLPNYLRSRIRVVQRAGGANGGRLSFSNGSRIRVGNVIPFRYVAVSTYFRVGPYLCRLPTKGQRDPNRFDAYCSRRLQTLY